MPHSSASDLSRSLLAAACIAWSFGPSALQAADAELPRHQQTTDQRAGDRSTPNETLIAQGPRLLPQAVRDAHETPKRVRQTAQREHDRRAERVRTISPGTSSRSAYKAAVAALPLDKLAPEKRARVEEFLKKASIFRELPTLSFEVQPAVYQYFLSHPDAAVSIWRAMEVSQFQMFQTGPVTYEADAADGTLGLVEVLLRSETENMVICNGEYKSPMLSQSIKATALMHLRTHFGKSENGKPLAQHRLTMFVDFPSLTVETAAKIVSPVSNYIVDRNFQEVSVFLYMMSLAMTRRPDWVEHIAAKMDGVLEPSRAELIDLTTQLYTAAEAPVPVTAGPSPGTVPHSSGNVAAPQSTEPKRLTLKGRSATIR